MVNKIYGLKNKFIDHIETVIAQRGGIERIDVKEMGELVDIVKDFAEAECYCMQAKYYDTVTKAMEESSGYNQQMPASSGYTSRDQQVAGYGMGRSGYTDMLDPLRQKMQTASPDERARMRQDLLSLIGDR